MYDMKADPREMNSVFGKPEYAKVQKELREQMCIRDRSTAGSNPMTPGLDWGAYPKSKVFTFGLDIQF